MGELSRTRVTVSTTQPVFVVLMQAPEKILSVQGQFLSLPQEKWLLNQINERAADWLPMDAIAHSYRQLQTGQLESVNQSMGGQLKALGLDRVEWTINSLYSHASNPLMTVVAYPVGEDVSPEHMAKHLSIPEEPPARASRGNGEQLSQITRNIRRTLDLETIWQQTVDGLGEMFCVQQVWMGSYQPGIDSVTVAAEYCCGEMPSIQGRTYQLETLGYLRPAFASNKPIINRTDVPDAGGAILAVATRYQDQPNGLIVMYARQDTWSPKDLELINELADQVGTAVAHARRFGERHALAVKLQQANASLMEKHRQLEEAKRQAEIAREQAEEASRLKSEFLANTSHELRTPLNGMIGFLRLVLDGMADDPEEQEEFIKEAHKSALHLLDLINDVLDIAKIEAGKMQLDMRAVSLRELFNAVESFTRPMAEQKQLEFNIHLPPTRDEIILNGNYQRLLQVMLNLVGNAIKFTHEGSITISAEIKPQKVTFKDDTWPGTVKVSVADTGIGVSLEKQDRLFQTFSQVDGERTRQYGGTGLGLAISQKLVEAMGGVVQFISMGEGLGSTVTFTALLYHEPVLASSQTI